MSISRLLIFVSIMVSVLGGAHYYLWKRLIKDTALPSPWHQALSGLLLALLATVPITMVSMRSFPRETIAPVAFLGFIWMGLLSTYFVLLSSTDLARGLRRGVKRIFFRSNNGPTDPKRRALLGRLMAGGVAASGTTLGAAGIKNVLDGFTVVEIDIHLDKLPKAFDGFRIVQMSDIHVGPTIGGEFVRRVVATSNQLKPDLVAITGDLVDGSVEHLGRHTQPLGDLTAKYGVFFVTGNHEYYSGAEDWIAELKRIGIPTLRNESVRLTRGEASLLVAGVTDHRAGEFGDPPDLAHALRGRKKNEEVVLLAHQPRELTEAKKLDVGLQLSGHTHGGQFWPWNWVVHLVQPVVAGLARFGRTQVYVNTGTGYWGPPMRMGTDSEITLVTLRATS